ncbi:hypothetical protein Hanom_Chr16g01486171 [Helianthus anomalus]
MAFNTRKDDTLYQTPSRPVFQTAVVTSRREPIMPRKAPNPTEVFNPNAASLSDILRFLGHKRWASWPTSLPSTELKLAQSVEVASLEESSPPKSSGSDQGPPNVFRLCHSSAGGWSSNSLSSKPAASAPLGRGIFYIENS